MSTPMRGTPAWDTRKYICEPYFGRKGAAYSRRFKIDFIGALHGQIDKFASLYDHYMREDPGAVRVDGSNVPHPGTANSNLRQESELAYTLRSKKLYSLIWAHVEDIDMRAQLETVAGNGLAAWAELEHMANLPTTGLTQVKQDTDWVNLKLTDVGQTEDTIIRFVNCKL